MALKPPPRFRTIMAALQRIACQPEPWGVDEVYRESKRIALANMDAPVRRLAVRAYIAAIRQRID